MSRRRPPLIVTALALLAAAAALGPVESRARDRAGGGEIVFVSARASEDPGEIYALGAGGSRRPVFHSAYAEVGLATSPTGPAIAFWSDRSGSWRLMLSADGVSLRSVPIAGAG